MTADVHPVRAEHTRIAKPNGWWGMAVFVATEATLFGAILGTYYYLRFNSPSWPPPGVPEPDATLPLILTAAIVATSVPVQLAFSSARQGRRAVARWLLLLALLVQATYFGVQMHLFLSDLDKFSPSQSAYGSIYFTMLGAHHAHVVVGMLLELFLFLRLASGITNYRLIGLQTTAFYWHFVNVLAIAVVVTQLSPRL